MPPARCAPAAPPPRPGRAPRPASRRCPTSAGRARRSRPGRSGRQPRPAPAGHGRARPARGTVPAPRPRSPARGGRRAWPAGRRRWARTRAGPAPRGPPPDPRSRRGRARGLGTPGPARKRSGNPGNPAAAGTGPSRPASTNAAPDRVAAATTAAASAGDRVEASAGPMKVRSAPVAAWSRPVHRGSMGSPKASVQPPVGVVHGHGVEDVADAHVARGRAGPEQRLRQLVAGLQPPVPDPQRDRSLPGGPDQRRAPRLHLEEGCRGVDGGLGDGRRGPGTGGAARGPRAAGSAGRPAGLEGLEPARQRRVARRHRGHVPHLPREQPGAGLELEGSGAERGRDLLQRRSRGTLREHPDAGEANRHDQRRKAPES